MWRRKRAIRRLKDELAQARADRARLQRRLEALEMIAAATGAEALPETAAPMPPVLAAAARELRATEVPVHLDVAGSEVIAVLGGAGDPRQWWSAIWQFAAADEAQP